MQKLYAFFHRRDILLFAGFFLLLLVVYGASLANPFFLLDDGLLIFENNAVRGITPTTLSAIFTSYDPELYIPLTLFSYQIDYLIGGYSPFIYHFTSLLLHAGTSALVAGCMYRLTEKKWMSLFAGLLFALHPLQVEAVAWASGRKDVLAGFFFFLSLYTYLSFLRGTAESAVQNQSAGTSKRLYWVSAGMFLLGLLAKVTVVPLPVILLLVDWYKGRRGRSIFTEKLPYFALAIIFGVVAMFGKHELTTSISPLAMILLAGKSMVFFLTKFLLPIHLNVFYPQVHAISLLHAEFAIPFLILFILCIAIVFAASRHAQSVLTRSILFGTGFFLLAIAPNFLSFAKGGGNIFFASDRFVYLALFGLIFILVSFVSRILSACSDQLERVIVAVLGCIVILCGLLSGSQALLWGNNVQHFERSTRVYPDFYLGYINLGVAYRLQNQKDEALAAFRKALSLRDLPNTYGLLAQVYADQGNFSMAIEEFKKGLAKDDSDYELHHGLGQVYALQHNFDAALAEYERALELMPEPGNTYLQLSRRASARRDVVLQRIGILYGEQGNHQKAIEYYNRALQENPQYADVYFNLGVAYGMLQDPDTAIAEYQKAIELDPHHIRALVNLGILLVSHRGDTEGAKEIFERVLGIDPTNETAHEAVRRLNEAQQ